MQKLLGLPELASVHGADVDKFIIYVHYLMIVLFIGWGAYFLYALWRFRRSANPKADYKGVTSHASSYVELAVAGIEVVLLVGFAIPLWAKVADQFPSEGESQMVRVTAQQFAWSSSGTKSSPRFAITQSRSASVARSKRTRPSASPPPETSLASEDQSAGSRFARPVARSKACAAEMIRPSSQKFPMIWSPTGSPSLSPQGTLIEGSPATEAGIV